MEKNEKILIGAACFFAGVVTGFMIAPIKKGIFCGNNSGNNNGNHYNEENEELEEEVKEENNIDSNEEAKELDESMAEISEIIIDNPEL